MREIKFRAWNKENKHFRGNILGKYERLAILNSKDFEIMQYTGLKDKNGKGIYEGDIVLYPDTYSETVDVGVGGGLKVAETPENSFGPVVFFGGSFCLDCSGGETLGKGIHTFQYIYNEYGFEIDELEVIGNIYENPELLEGK